MLPQFVVGEIPMLSTVLTYMVWMSVIFSSKLGSISKKETLQPKIWVGLRERGKKKERERERGPAMKL